MVKTLPLSELEKHSENVYEAIMVIAKRARQINEEQKTQMDSAIDTDELREDHEEEEDKKETEETIEEKELVKEEKPTMVALEEMLQGKLRYEYKDRAALENTN